MTESVTQWRDSRSTSRAKETVPLFVLVLFCVYVISWFLQVSLRIEFLGPLRFELVLGTVLAFIAAAMLATKAPAVGHPGKRVIGVTLLLVFMITIRVPLSIESALAWDLYVERVLKFAFMAVFLVAFVRSERDMRWFIAAFLLACGYICQESVRGALSGAMVWENQGVPRLHGSTPLFSHPNSLGGLAIGVLPFAYFLFFATQSRFMRIALLLLAAMALAVVMYSGSRTAYVGVLALLIYILVSARLSFVKMLAIGMAVGLLLVAAMPDVYKARFATISTGQEIEGNSMGTRRQIIADSVEILAEYPLGVGVNGFRTKRMEMFGRNQDTHNLYLQVATQLGVQGLLVFVLFVVVLWKGLSGVIRRLAAPPQPDCHMQSSNRTTPVRRQWFGTMFEQTTFLLAVARAAQAYLLVRLVLGLFGHDLYEIYWWIVTGILLSLLTILGRGGNGGQSGGRALRTPRVWEPGDSAEVGNSRV